MVVRLSPNKTDRTHIPIALIAVQTVSIASFSNTFTYYESNNCDQYTLIDLPSRC